MSEIELKDAKVTSLSLQAPVEFDKASTQTGKDFVIKAYTGEVVDRWWGRLAINIDGIKAKQQIPIFRDHDRATIVGYSKETWSGEYAFYVSGVFSQVTDAAKEVKGLAGEGFPWQASIGVMPKKILQLDDGVETEVNGRKLKGPAEVWLQSEVFETSFVPLGADGNTSISVFSRFEEKDNPSGGDPERKTNMTEEKKEPVALTVESLRADHPDITAALLAEGARIERERIQEVLGQAMPGHDELVTRLAFDGKTTGAEAAVQILKAERQLRNVAAQHLASDAPAPVATPVAPVIELSDNSNLPIEERAKKEWDNKSETRAEFKGDYGAYLAFRKAEESGLVKILGK